MKLRLSVSLMWKADLLGVEASPLHLHVDDTLANECVL